MGEYDAGSRHCTIDMASLLWATLCILMSIVCNAYTYLPSPPGRTTRQVKGSVQYGRSVDFYKVLGLKPSCTLQDIKKAYYERAKQTHPDLCRGRSHEEFMLVKEAYFVLHDPETRSSFDRRRAVGELADMGIKAAQILAVDVAIPLARDVALPLIKTTIASFDETVIKHVEPQVKGLMQQVEKQAASMFDSFKQAWDNTFAQKPALQAPFQGRAPTQRRRRKDKNRRPFDLLLSVTEALGLASMAFPRAKSVRGGASTASGATAAADGGAAGPASSAPGGGYVTSWGANDVETDKGIRGGSRSSDDASAFSSVSRSSSSSISSSTSTSADAGSGLFSSGKKTTSTAGVGFAKQAAMVSDIAIHKVATISGAGIVGAVASSSSEQGDVKDIGKSAPGLVDGLGPEWVAGIAVSDPGMRGPGKHSSASHSGGGSIGSSSSISGAGYGKKRQLSPWQTRKGKKSRR